MKKAGYIELNISELKQKMSATVFLSDGLSIDARDLKDVKKSVIRETKKSKGKAKFKIFEIILREVK